MRSYVIGASISSAAQLDDEVRKYLKNAQKLAQAAAANGPSSAPSSSPAVPAPSTAVSAVPTAVPVGNADAPLAVAGISGSAVVPSVSAAPVNTVSARWQNVAPEEMWKRVTQCVMPAYPAAALSAQITGTVNIGLGISP
jgi:hypothetical protein